MAAQEGGSQCLSTFPFKVDTNDHCETPFVAYEQIGPVLRQLITFHGSDSLIYDPYYCNGSVIERMNAAGFDNVYNVKEDCYVAWKSTSEPKFDVLVTNPPYSGDHMERLFEYLTCPAFGSRPWLVLAPTWLHKKDFYVRMLGYRRPVYVVPLKRYIYSPPPQFRDKKKSDTQKKSSPFTSMWYIWAGTIEMSDLLKRWISKNGMSGCEIAWSKSSLRDLRRKSRIS